MGWSRAWTWAAIAVGTLLLAAFIATEVPAPVEFVGVVTAVLLLSVGVALLFQRDVGVTGRHI